MPIKDKSGKDVFVVSNPFDWELLMAAETGGDYFS